MHQFKFNFIDNVKNNIQNIELDINSGTLKQIKENCGKIYGHENFNFTIHFNKLQFNFPNDSDENMKIAVFLQNKVQCPLV